MLASQQTYLSKPSPCPPQLLRDPLGRALRRWREMGKKYEYSRGVSYDAKMLSEVTSLAHCFEADLKLQPTSQQRLTPEVWERCVASVCGVRGCIAGTGVYFPQLVAWTRAAASFRWIALPVEAFRVQVRITENLVADQSLL